MAFTLRPCRYCGLGIWRVDGPPVHFRDKGGSICPKDGLWHQPFGDPLTGKVD